jgi:hypothetical protein
MLMLLLRVDYSMRTYIIRMSPRKRYLSAGQKKKDEIFTEARSRFVGRSMTNTIKLSSYFRHLEEVRT